MQSKVIPLSRRLALLSPEQRAEAIRHLQACAEAMQAADEQFTYEKFFAIGQHAAIALMRPRDAREIARIDPYLIDDWHPMPAYGWGFPLYAATHDVTDPGDVCRADVECYAGKLLGEPYPEADEVRAFLDGVADVVDRL